MNEPILLKELPRYECFMEAAQMFPECDPSAMYAFTMLLHTHDVMWKQKCAHYAEHGITQGRFMMMILLMDNEVENEKTSWFTARTPAELADMAQISRASVTGFLDSLEKDEFVKRKPDPSDRRMVSIHLTEKGRAFMDSLLPPHFRMINKMMGGLDEKERVTLVELLHKMIDGANAYIAENKKSAS